MNVVLLQAFQIFIWTKLNHIKSSLSYINFIIVSMVFPVISVWTARCDKLQHNPLVLSFPLSKILGSMKEILSPSPATGLSSQHVRKNFIWHHKTSGCTVYQHNWLTANCGVTKTSMISKEKLNLFEIGWNWH